MPQLNKRIADEAVGFYVFPASECGRLGRADLPFRGRSSSQWRKIWEIMNFFGYPHRKYESTLRKHPSAEAILFAIVPLPSREGVRG